MKRTKHIKIFILFLLTIFYCSAIFAGYYDDIDWVSKSYKDGEPDYSDGDLEDKLGDSGYYYDLFPEERDGEPDDIIHHLNQKETIIVILKLMIIL